MSRATNEVEKVADIAVAESSSESPSSCFSNSTSFTSLRSDKEEQIFRHRKSWMRGTRYPFESVKDFLAGETGAVTLNLFSS
jgi:hypothetical protein